MEIPFGRIVSYGDIADEMGVAGAARAVGQAVGANPLPIVVPCHRVVRSDGRLGGYSGGLLRKVALLGIEGVTSTGTGREAESIQSCYGLRFKAWLI